VALLNVPSRRAAVLLLLHLGSRAAAATQEPPAAFDAFPAYLYRLDGERGAGDEAALAVCGGTQLPGEADAAWVASLGLRHFLWQAAGRDALHLDRDSAGWTVALERWRETRDRNDLVREPCLADPATAAELEAKLERSLAPAARGGADFVALGDEIGLTPYGDPLDVCACEHCERHFQGWLEQAGARYGLAPGDRRVGTDSLLSAADGALLGRWLATRAHGRALVAETVQRLAQRCAELRPGVPPAVLGLIGETAFGGVDLEALGTAVPVVEPYAVADAVERLATLRARGAGPRRLLATLFLDRPTSPDQLLAELRRLGSGPVDGIVVWSDRELATRPELLAALDAGLRELRAARGATPGLDRDPRGVAWLASDDNLALAFLRDARSSRGSWWRRLAGWQEQRGTMERARREWFAAARARGEDPGAISLEQVDGDLWPRFTRLVAVDLRVVADAELAGLQRFVDRGGTVELRGTFADLRPDGSKRPAAALPPFAAGREQ
jgi:hypothetical protein